MVDSRRTGEVLILIDQQARTFEIGRQTGWTVGRDPTNSLVLNDIKVSRRHAVVRWEGDHFVVRDMGSRNGTFVDGERIDQMMLDDGNIIRIGDSEFLVRIAAQKMVEEELFNQQRQMASLETHMDMEDEFRIHDKGFSGSLKTLSMVEIIQTIMQFGKDGLLRICDYDDLVVAEAFFVSGEVVHAEFDTNKGLGAMFDMMKLDEGVFEFQNEIPAPERTISQSTMSILMESCRRMDESRR